MRGRAKPMGAAVALVLSASGAAQADFSPPQVVASRSGGLTALQADGAGNVLMAYTQASGTTLRLRPTGGSFGPAERIRYGSTLVLESRKRVLRVWIGGSRRSPRVAVATVSGGRQVGPTQLLQPPGRQGYVGELAAAAGAGGRAAIIWTSARGSLSRQRLLAAFRTAGASRFGKVRALTPTAPIIEHLQLTYDHGHAVAAWERRLQAGSGTYAIEYARERGSRFGPAATLAPRVGSGELLKLVSSGGGPLAVWQTSKLSVQPLQAGSRRDSVTAPVLSPEQIDGAGSALIAAWAVYGDPASAPNACDGMDVEEVAWNPASGFGAPRDLGPAGGDNDGAPGSLTVALAPSGKALIAWDVAPNHVDDPVFSCIPRDDVVRAVTLDSPTAAPTAPVTLSGPAPPTQPCRSCAGRGEWSVRAAASDGVLALAWSYSQIGVSFFT